MKTHSEIYANALPLLPREVQDMLIQLPTPDTVKVVRGHGGYDDIMAFTWEDEIDQDGQSSWITYSHWHGDKSSYLHWVVGEKDYEVVDIVSLDEPPLPLALDIIKLCLERVK